MKFDPVTLPARRTGRPGGLERPARAGLSATAGGARSFARGRKPGTLANPGAAEASSPVPVIGNDRLHDTVRITANPAR